MKYFILVLLYFLFLAHCFAQPSIEWAKCYGGSFDERANAIVKADNGDYIIVGSTNSNNGDVSGLHGGSNGASDVWVIRIDSARNLLWQKCYGGTREEKGNSICKTFDNGFIIAGYCTSTDGDVISNYGGADYWVIKIDSSGNLLWQKSYGGSNDDFANSIIQTQDSGYIVEGYTSSNDSDVTGNHGLEDIWIVKLDSIGNITLEKCFGGSGHDYAGTIKQLGNGNFIASGTAGTNDGDIVGNHGQWDFWLMQIDSVGSLVTQKCYGGTLFDMPTAMEFTSDNGYIISGTSNSIDGDVIGNMGNIDFWIVRLDSLYNIVWQKCLGGSGSEGGSFTKETPDGGYIVAGTTDSQASLLVYNYHGYDDYELIKLDSLRNIEWQWCYGGTANDDVLDILVTPDNNYLITGYTGSEDGDITGQHSGLDTYHDFWIMKTGNTIAEVSALTNTKFEITIYPNPTTNNFTVKNNSSKEETLLQITNPIGEIVYEEKLFGRNECVVNSNLLSGIYFVSVNDGERNIVMKLIVE